MRNQVARRLLVIFFLPSLLSGLARADEVFLKGGGKVSGVIVERGESTVAVETGPGRVTIALTRVERIVEGGSALKSFHERAAVLASDDVAGWAALARWAAELGLATQAREAWFRVLAVDPAHAEANADLGHVRLDGVWRSEDEAYGARGFVRFEGRWVSPSEHEALLRERAAEEAVRSERAEATVRLREAEARAREAEARAREAEAAAYLAEAPAEGIPYGWIFGGGGPFLFPPSCPPRCGPVVTPPGPPPHVRPPHPHPTPKPATDGTRPWRGERPASTPARPPRLPLKRD